MQGQFNVMMDRSDLNHDQDYFNLFAVLRRTGRRSFNSVLGSSSFSSVRGCGEFIVFQGLSSLKSCWMCQFLIMTRIFFLLTV